MKKFAALFAVALVSVSLAPIDAEAARRLGGGKSSGMQREAISPAKPTAPPASQASPSAANPSPMQSAPAAAAAQPKRSWMGPLAGLAAGLGLAALASHFGFGEALANAMLIGLLVIAALAVVGFIMRRRASAMQPVLQGAGAGAPWAANAPLEPASAAPTQYASAAPIPGSAHNLPADFDVAGFVRQAKVSFLRLQAAHDNGNLDDIREFTTPEMFGEIKAALMERGSAKQETDVVELSAEVLDVSQDATRHVVSVRFLGTARIDRGSEVEAIDEIWHIVKPQDGSRGWTLAGIQQVQ